MKFKKNLHRAINCRRDKIEKWIKNYPSKYPTPKYLLFIKKFADAGWKVKLYEAKVSKYVFIIKDNQIFKIRFSNHPPLLQKELEEDCDYYVGVSNKQVTTTEEIIKNLL